MKIQNILFIALMTSILSAVDAQASSCTVQRLYQDTKHILRHMTIQSLTGEAAQFKGACKSACAREARTLPANDAQQLKNAQSIDKVLLQCTYASKDGEGMEILAESSVMLSQLKPARKSYNNSASRVNMPAGVITRSRPAAVQPSVNVPVVPSNNGTQMPVTTTPSYQPPSPKVRSSTPRTRIYQPPSGTRQPAHRHRY